MSRQNLRPIGLIETTLRLVSSIAQRHSSAGIPVLDLIQKGNESLPAALKTFTQNSNDSFAIHAADCIEQAIVKFIAESKSARETRS